MKHTLLIILLAALLFTLSFTLGKVVTRRTQAPAPSTPVPSSTIDTVDLPDVPEATLSAQEATRSAGTMIKDITVTTKPEGGTRIKDVPKQLEIHFSAPIRFGGIGVSGSSGGIRLPEPPKVSVAGLFVIIPFPTEASSGTYTVNYTFCSLEKDATERKDDCRDASFSFELQR